ncbi:purine-binding chemotaxis protein CheW [Rhodoblastus acidophilus]|uniref:Purine-binding chemotaxis protein CheW n=1 Tax=Rhodoblastus acidophilus TaxID=1074 RepID=A0A212S9B7_RHOAC|nr:chemotaxis protein CheW [Rhodoblastus acidophilus]PPQ36252.1 chemotaxis protein CheW [Rhodoblastus acidophilus]RAI20426.1 chemotaxis protein CheW [Rhodoblastus acidophilus]SNB81839.1 purine-binding chemotaxis protein CheW [Rhodoblastus acidophilus]
MSAHDELQLVTFALDAECFALPVRVVREILDHERAFRVPNGPRHFLGLCNVRGQGVPVIDLRMRLGLPPVEPTSATRVLVVDVALGERALTLGIVVDRVFEVTAVRKDEIEAAPDIGARWASDYIDGVVRRDQSFVVIVNLARLLSEKEAADLAADVAAGLAAAPESWRAA